MKIGFSPKIQSDEQAQNVLSLCNRLDFEWSEIARHRKAIKYPDGENPFACKRCAGPLSNMQPINHYAELKRHEQEFKEYARQLKVLL